MNPSVDSLGVARSTRVYRQAGLAALRQGEDVDPSGLRRKKEREAPLVLQVGYPRVGLVDRPFVGPLPDEVHLGQRQALF